MISTPPPHTHTSRNHKEDSSKGGFQDSSQPCSSAPADLKLSTPFSGIAVLPPQSLSQLRLFSRRYYTGTPDPGPVGASRELGTPSSFQKHPRHWHLPILWVKCYATSEPRICSLRLHFPVCLSPEPGNGMRERTFLAPRWISSNEEHWWAWTLALGILLPPPLTLWSSPPPGSQESTTRDSDRRRN